MLPPKREVGEKREQRQHAQSGKHDEIFTESTVIGVLMAVVADFRVWIVRVSVVWHV